MRTATLGRSRIGKLGYGLVVVGNRVLPPDNDYVITVVGIIPDFYLKSQRSHPLEPFHDLSWRDPEISANDVETDVNVVGELSPATFSEQVLPVGALPSSCVRGSA